MCSSDLVGCYEDVPSVLVLHEETEEGFSMSVCACVCVSVCIYNMESRENMLINCCDS